MLKIGSSVAAMCLTSSFACAQGMMCGPYDGIKKHLEEKYKEAPVLTALSGSTLTQIFVSNDLNTGTVLAIFPDGKACLVAELTNIETSGNLKAVKGDPVGYQIP